MPGLGCDDSLGCLITTAATAESSDLYILYVRYITHITAIIVLGYCYVSHILIIPIVSQTLQAQYTIRPTLSFTRIMTVTTNSYMTMRIIIMQSTFLECFLVTLALQYTYQQRYSQAIILATASLKCLQFSNLISIIFGT